MLLTLFPLPRPAQRRLTDRRQTRAPQRVSVDPGSAHLLPPDPLAHQQARIKRGRDITWSLRAMLAPEWVVEQWPGSVTISAVRSHGIREGHPQDETVYYVYSLRTGVKALLITIRQRWSIKNSWHWVRDVPLREDAHRYREINGVQILATRRSLAINALSLDGFWSITDGIAALAHDIKGLLRLMGWRQTAAGTRQDDY